MKFLNSIWTAFKSTVKGFDTPRQLALGVAFGMIIGLIPKDSLFPYAIGVIALLSTANLLCVVVSAFIFSWISPLLDPASHQIGAWILTFDPLETMWASLMQLPMVAWTRFDNTVVMGSGVLGMVLSFPVYLMSHYCFEKFGSAIRQAVANTRVARWLVGVPTTLPQKS